MSVEAVGAVLFGLIALWLLTQPWFWIAVLFLGALASFFAVLASIIHFEILGAVGFFILMAGCLYGLSLFSDYVQDRRAARKRRALKRRFYEGP